MAAATTAAEPPAPATMLAGNGIASVELQRAPNSHFYADALVNGSPVRFIVDTAATSVVLTRADAQRVGLLGGDFSVRGRGAGGEVRLMPVTITRLAVGPVGAEQVPAMVAEDGLQVSLLGQTYLQRVGTVTIEGDRMVLR
jgi:aspartyl protease family protein